MVGNYLLSAIIGYAIGCFSSAYFLSKMVKKGDIRKYGSGNAGTTNMIRAYGLGIGLVTLLLDALKGILALVIGYLIGGEVCGLIGGLFAVIGHILPFYLGFKGGKGIATTLGIIIAVNPLVGFLLFILGLVIALVTQYVSLSSLTVVLLFPIICLFLYPTRAFLLFVALVLAGLAIYTHRENIKRLKNGTENKTNLIAKLKK